MSLDEDFALLRELLAHPVQKNDWNQQLYELFERVRLENPEHYSTLWLPYCEQHKEMFLSVIKEVYSIEELQKWSRLMPFALFHLNVFGQSLQLDQMLNLFHSPLLGHVQDLFLGRNNIELYTLNELLKSNYLSNIRLLELSENQIDSTAVKILASADTVSKIEELDLSINEVDDEGAFAIANSSTLGKLRSLNLSGTRISARGIRAIEKSSQLSSLRDVIA